MTQDVLDMLIVGGGPGGTAAAFRARELGIEPLLVEHDDLMKRIRDYSKDKLILPSFGGGDRMRFPQCGDLISCLHFQAIDKDDMCTKWKALHAEHGIRSRIGVELTGLTRRADGLWAVQAWDHAQRCEAPSSLATWCSRSAAASPGVSTSRARPTASPSAYATPRVSSAPRRASSAAAPPPPRR